MPTPTRELTVAAVRRIADCGVFELDATVAGAPLDYRAGQWISLHLPAGARPPAVRGYTLAEPAAADTRIRLAFDAVPGGVGSTYLSGLSGGERIPFTGPLGNFTLDGAADTVVMVGRFTGVVPLRCMLLEAAARGPAPRRALLLQTAESPAGLVYRDELAALAANTPWLDYRAEVVATDGVAEIELLADLLPAGTDFTPYLCGLSRVVRPLRAHLVERGFARRAVRCERYD